MNVVKLKALLASYLRSTLSAVAALYLAGVTEPIKFKEYQINFGNIESNITEKITNA